MKILKGLELILAASGAVTGFSSADNSEIGHLTANYCRFRCDSRDFADRGTNSCMNHCIELLNKVDHELEQGQALSRQARQINGPKQQCWTNLQFCLGSAVQPILYVDPVPAYPQPTNQGFNQQNQGANFNQNQQNYKPPPYNRPAGNRPAGNRPHTQNRPNNKPPTQKPPRQQKRPVTRVLTLEIAGGQHSAGNDITIFQNNQYVGKFTEIEQNGHYSQRIPASGGIRLAATGDDGVHIKTIMWGEHHVASDIWIDTDRDPSYKYCPCNHYDASCTGSGKSQSFESLEFDHISSRVKMTKCQEGVLEALSGTRTGNVPDYQPGFTNPDYQPGRLGYKRANTYDRYETYGTYDTYDKYDTDGRYPKSG